MGKYLGGSSFWTLAGVFVFGLVVGINWAMFEYSYSNIWPEERGGLKKLNELLKNDKTDRLAMVVLTQKQQVAISAMEENIGIQLGLLEKGKP
jgi:hypothetical protein